MNIIFTCLCWGFIMAALEVVSIFCIVRAVRLIRTRVATKWLWFIFGALVAQAVVMYALGTLISFTAGA